MAKPYFRVTEIKNGGNIITVYHIVNDLNGNPRCVVRCEDLGVSPADYDVVNKKYGFNKYRGGWIDNGVVFQVVNLDDRIKFMLEKVKEVDSK